LSAGRKHRNLSSLNGKTAKLFLEAIESPATRSTYERWLATFLEHVGMDVDAFVEKAKAQPKWAEETIMNYLLKQKERVLAKEIEANTVRNMKKPIRLLLEMNDVSGVNWKKISRVLPSARRYALDRAPTIEELRLLLSNVDLRSQAILLTMVSSGIRMGAWDYLDWGHVKPLERDGEVVAAKLKVYAAEPEEYETFITAETYQKLKQYMQLRKSKGEKITKDSPLIRDKWGTFQNIHEGDINKPNRLHADGVKRVFEDMLWKHGLRKEKKKRHEFSTHSLRKFFKTRAEQVMKPINVETLMGHSTGISDGYYRPTEKELLEDYVKAAPLLTISEAEEVRRESRLSRQQLEDRLKQIEGLVSQLVAEKGEQVLSQGQNRRGDTSKRESSKKVVKADEIEKFISEGWEPVMNLADGRIVMKSV